MSTDLVYHYCSLEALKGIIETRCLWASSFRYLNDRSEAIVSQNALGENHDVVLKALANSPALNSLKRSLAKISVQELEFYITSFSKRADKLSQWLFYADKGRGVAIGFRRGLFSNVLVNEVLYGEFESHLAKVCASLAANFSGNTKAYQRRCTRELIELIGLAKSEAFEEEEECRLIAFHDKHDPTMEVKFRRSGNFLAPYVEIDLNPNWSERIAEVWLGPMIKDDLVKRSIRYFLNKNEIADVTLSDSRAPFRQL